MADHLACRGLRGRFDRMRRATKRRVRFLLGVLGSGTLIGAAYGGLTGLVFGLPASPRAMMSAIDGAAITAPITAVEMFLLRSRWGRPLQQASFLVTFGVKWLVYSMVITIVVLGAPGERVLGLPLTAAPLQTPLVRLALLFSVVVTFAFTVVMELRQIVGPRNLRNIVLGRYHTPRVEERFFLFIDIVGSTQFAERLGASAVHRFLAAVFRLASEPIADHRGEIYQYVGDEMVVTWTLAEARDDARPVACFFAVETVLEEAAPAFMRDYGFAPQLRAALHAGKVISGEVGDTKREIVFHGDVMNTTARLEQATRDLDRRFLISADALSRLTATEQYALEPLGPQMMRGRSAPVDVYAVGAKR